MTETKLEDVLIPLLKNHYDEVEFNKIFDDIRENPKPLYLEDDFGLSINFIYIKNPNELEKIVNSLKNSPKFKCIKENQQDSIDDLFLNEGTYLFNRKIFRSEEEIKVEISDCDDKKVYLFSWDKIQGNDIVRLIEFLNLHFAIEWVKTAEIKKTDAGRAIKVFTGKKNLSLSLNDDKTKVYLKIDDGRTYEFIAKTENSKLNIYKKVTYEFPCRLFINIANIQYNDNNKIPYHIISLILTSFNNKKSNLCNKQIINLVNGELNAHNSFSTFNDLPEEVENLFEKDEFVAIQLWNHRWKSEKNNTFDAKTYVKENPYYFYSIITLEEEIYRRNYANVMDVLGWCQSASSAYFDVFYGTTCLELTIKPKIEIFDETGHDSDEFRIWELLALQKKLLDEINKKNMNNVDAFIEELDLIYNFKIFTNKIGKGEKWIRYGEYLQKITGIDSAYQDYKLKKEIKNKEQESKLQKLNVLIIVSIFASFLTLLLSPIYSSWIPTSLYFENIVKNPNRELKAIHLASILTCLSYLYVYDANKLKSVNIFRDINKLKFITKLKSINIFRDINKLKFITNLKYINKLKIKYYSIFIKSIRIIFVVLLIISFFKY